MLVQSVPFENAHRKPSIGIHVGYAKEAKLSRVFSDRNSLRGRTWSGTGNGEAVFHV